MKQPNPLLPQGSFEAQARGKSQVRLAVFTILAIHVVVLGALLIHGAGCKRTDTADNANPAPPTNEPTPPFTPEVVTPAVTNNSNTAGNFNPTGGLPPIPGAGTGVTAIPPTPSPSNFVPPLPPPPVPPTPPPASDLTAGTASEHTIVKGDTLGDIAKKSGVTLKALLAANPGVEPAKLKIGQKIKIPAKTASPAPAPASAIGAEGNAVGAAPSDVYVVKSGDVLYNIAKDHHTTVKAIQKLNNLATTQIKVGQKLKMPAPKTLPASKATPSPAMPGGTLPPSPGGSVPLLPAPAQ